MIIMKTFKLFIFFLSSSLLAVGQTLQIKPDKKGKLGYFDSEGNKVISCQFEEADPFSGGVARVRLNGKYGLINEKGKAVGAGIKYVVMDYYASTGAYIVCEGGSEAKPKDKIASRQGISPQVFGGSTNYPIKGGNWGVIDREGKVLVKADYDEISDPINGMIYVVKGKNTGFLDAKYNVKLMPKSYNYMGCFVDDIAWINVGGKLVNGVVIGGKFGLINRDGKVVISPKYEVLSAFSNSIVGYKYVNKKGFVDDDGNVVVPIPTKTVGKKTVEDSDAYDKNYMAYIKSHPQISMPNSTNADKLVPFAPFKSESNGYLWFNTKKGLKPGLVDVSGKVLVAEKKYDVICLPSDGMMRFYTSVVDKKTITHKWGFLNIDTKKEAYTDPDYYFSQFVNGVSKASRKDGELYYFVDKDLHEFSDRYTQANDFVEGYCVVARNGRYGVLDRKGKETVPLEYDNLASSISEGLLAAYKNGKWGYITPNNAVSIPFNYDSANSFLHGVATVCKNELWGQIDKQNQFILPIVWKDFIIPESYPTTYYWVKKADDCFYYYDTRKAAITFPKDGAGYSVVEPFGDKPYAKVKSSAYYGAIQNDGTVAIPFVFDKYSDVDQAAFYLQKNKITQFKDVDLKRFKIILRGTSNGYKLSDKVNEDDWDY
jgi:hypothetical protein